MMPLKNPALGGDLDQAPPNVIPFLQTLAYAEIGPALLDESRNGYDVLVGSLPGSPNLFEIGKEHPLLDKPALEYRDGIYSTAAGRYQILSRFWPHYRDQLGLEDFGPLSQDLYALQQIKEQGALEPLRQGYFKEAILRCANIWASLPGNSYGQPQHRMETLGLVFHANGGYCDGQDLHWLGEVLALEQKDD